MDKLWYPVAFSALIVSCGGDVNTSSPTSSGGSTGVDSGTPTATGGVQPMPPYGPMTVPAGGSYNADGGGSGIGGQAFASTAPIDSGIPRSTGGYPTTIYGIN